VAGRKKEGDGVVALGPQSQEDNEGGVLNLKKIYNAAN